MAFVTLEDLYGTLEILVFPNVLERYRRLLQENNKIFVSGRVSIGDDEQGKLICEKIVAFEQIPRELWIQFPNKQEYVEKESELIDILKNSDGNDTVIIYCREEKVRKTYPKNMSITAGKELVNSLCEMYGDNNVKVVEKSIEIT
jgi:DNA polymerase-3 subunit alpha